MRKEGLALIPWHPPVIQFKQEASDKKKPFWSGVRSVQFRRVGAEVRFMKIVQSERARREICT